MFNDLGVPVHDEPGFRRSIISIAARCTAASAIAAAGFLVVSSGIECWADQSLFQLRRHFDIFLSLGKVVVINHGAESLGVLLIACGTILIARAIWLFEHL